VVGAIEFEPTTYGTQNRSGNFPVFFYL